MLLSLPISLALATACAPQVAPQTLLAIVQVESGFDPLAIGVNGAPNLTPRPRTAGEAAATARALIGVGRSIDLGLAQLNSRNLAALGVTIDQAFDPCRNLAAAARLLQANYAAALAEQPAGQAALRAALSRYNTGHPTRGLSNGYVAKVAAAVPALAPAPLTPPQTLASAPEPEAPAPAWDVFARAPASGGLLIRLAGPGSKSAGDSR
ncbi:lytic transglycosylase domain-containing protein [Phenylobacterium sp.]|uniref:lytic transglycosylase domain-containing protein n=1 Tax=Phenylobacterium sp. TaxID=1871053 RepID=UPI003BAC9655